MNNRLADIEILLMQHEDTIESLSLTLHRQQLEIAHLYAEIEKLESRLKTMQSSILKPENEETPPPHY